MRDAWRGPDGRARRRADGDGSTAENASRTLPLLLEREVERAVVVCAPPHLFRTRLLLPPALPGARASRSRFRVAAARTDRPLGRVGALRAAVPAAAAPRRAGRARPEAAVSDTVVFIPAWNEEENLPAVLDALRARLPEADVLVVDDGSTDRTAEVAREHGAEVLSLGTNQGLRIGIAAGYRWALEHGYAFCGRVDADGQHPAGGARCGCSSACARTSATSRSARASSPGTGYAPYRYRPSAARRLGTGRAAPLDGRRAAPSVRRRDERSLRGEREGAAAPRRAVHERGARGRGADPHRRRGPAARGGAGGHGAARRRRVEAARAARR